MILQVDVLHIRLIEDMSHQNQMSNLLLIQLVICFIILIANFFNWALDGVKWAVGSGLISGIEKNGVKDLAPQGNATRAQMAAILQRFCEQ